MLARPAVARLQESIDGTRKWLLRFDDGNEAECVHIPEEDRGALCVSSQVGCAQACRFCLTGSGGFRRNLDAFEIVDQILFVEKLIASGERAGTVHQGGGGNFRREPVRYITNIVLMGMGEPLANFDNVVQALRVITADKGLRFSPRRVTLSTDGLAPEIDRLGTTGIRVNLAISLNATTEAVRDRIMPVNRRYPFRELLAACRRFPLDERRRITFEYVLLSGVNDSGEDARRLVHLLKGIRSKVNLIPFNPFPGSEFRRPPDAAVRRFQKVLLDHHLTAPLRESRGRDISAACGQLREQEAALQP
jgi:23S rRNA (adenine2503-C2)-methyltransferase